MFLFKTSGATLASVVKNQKHAFKGYPRDWDVGEVVLISKNIADCGRGERQIQYVMALDSIRPIEPGESERYWPGTEGRWHYLVQCRDTQRINHPFNLQEALGVSATEYKAVMTFKRFNPEHERRIRAFLNLREPGLRQLLEARDAIEQEIGVPLVWDPNPEATDKVIAIYRDADLSHRNRWPKYLQWLMARLVSYTPTLPHPHGELESYHIEGTKKSRYTTYYERNPFYREKAIAIHGLVCMACEMDFEAKYGSWGA
ncbi:MAG: DUF4268 domain-containing protein, partial [Candidatus Tectomicrobia bacterium]|nr:DUF4268 domain-containing protein [Candidatus Tectomicrobia bacterium]